MSDKQVTQMLQETFGLERFRPGQQEVIQRLLEGQSALAIFPTGAGKSLCYQLPALLMEGLTLVVSPLIALMKDQLDALHRRGVAAARLDSSLDARTTRQVYQQVRAGQLKLLYVAPERLGNERFQELLSELNLALMAVDEAHCISEWGHNFRPDYMKLAQLARELKVPRVLGLTATATPAVAESIARAFAIAPENVVRSPFHRANLHLLMRPCRDDEERRRQLLSVLAAGPSIVYVTLQKTAEELARWLTQNGRKAQAYHAGLEAEERSRVQESFMQSTDGVVVATIAFGMGVDKADIRAVVHYNLPKSVENYAQEIGRAGRDGEVSRCTVLSTPEDRIALENFTFGDTPTAEALGALLEHLMQQDEEFDVSVYDLSREFDIRNLVVDTFLTYLELEGVLKATRPFYAEYRLAFLRSQGEILRRFDPARRGFLQSLLACGQPGRKWIKLDVHRAALELKEPRDRLVRAINYLEEQGDLELQVAGVRQGYRRMGPAADLARLVERFRTREVRDLERLDGVERMVHQAACTTATLLDYFGESLGAPCETCGVCRGEPPHPLVRERPGLSEHDRVIIGRVQGEEKVALAHPRQLARFLCGLTSPALTRDRLSRHPAFGALARLPFQTVLGEVESRVATPASGNPQGRP